MRIRKLLPILLVERIEPCLPFWIERLGFRATVQVPDGDRLGFLILEKDGAEIMYEAERSARRDPFAPAEFPPLGGSVLFLQVDDLDAVERALTGVEVVSPRHATAYGAQELAVREPAGNIVVFAEMA